MGRRNYLIESVSGSGKTSVCDELQRRGYNAIHGDRELAYQRERPDSEWGGGTPPDRNFVARLHKTREDIPKNGIPIDATAPIANVVDEIVRKAKEIAGPGARTW